MRRHSISFLSALLAVFVCGCASTAEQEGQSSAENTEEIVLQQGAWRATLTLGQGRELPFNFMVRNGTDGAPILTLLNGEEQLEVDDIAFRNDSVFITLHIFDTELQAKVVGGSLEGQWVKNGYETAYEIPFYAEAGTSVRFQQTAQVKPIADVSGKWEVDFLSEDGEVDKAIGLFEQSGKSLFGTFLTPTGDYRYLEGDVEGDSLRLSCFDGEHAYLFTAKVSADGQTLANGKFFSGKHWEQDWKAVRNEEVTLPDPHKLTYLKEGYDQLSFTFPDLQGEPVSLSDEKFENKVVVVQLMGSWCPNCMDETKFLAPFYDKYKDRGLAVIGLAYERSPDFDKASKRVKVLKEKLGVNYELLIAGVNDKEMATETLPMLNHVMSFPTTILIDRQGKVREIHTGFSGPGTGAYYERFVEDFTLMVEKLLAEEGEV